MSAAMKKLDANIDPTAFDDDEPTIIGARDLQPKAPAPPALPFALRRKKSVDEWLKALPIESRLVLEMVRSHQGRWPRAARVEGAVAQPITAIPSIAAIQRRR